ncbi:glycosyltransferase family 2 protein [Undibacterium sp. TJN19]|uniref:glycosyltransferase family 2 protein n=1 Tax=Undibacterium sp. TJN19 TaxID=3413055 RepID=UPI003BEFB0FE
MSKLVLSIYIPTYNRAGLLQHLLQSIVAGMTAWPDDLELIVSDNASTDNTQEVVASFIQQGFPFISLRNAENIGADRNFCQGFSKANGKYFWVIGDDEIMYQGTVNYVLEQCRSLDIGILYLANDGFGHNEQEHVLERKTPKEISARLLNSNEFFKSTNVFLTFISANVINREAVLAYTPDFDPNTELNTYLVQLSWTFTALKACRQHLYVNSRIFAALRENSSGYRLVEVFGVNLVQMTRKHLGTSIPDAERIMANAVITRFFPRQLMSQFSSTTSKNKFLDEDIVDVSTKCFSVYPLFHIFLKPILTGSWPTRQIVFFCVRVFNSINRWTKYRFL